MLGMDIYLPQISLTRDETKAWAVCEKVRKAFCWMDRKPVRWRIFSEDNGTGGSGSVIVKDDRPEVGAVEAPKPQAGSPGLGGGGKQLTLYQLKV